MSITERNKPPKNKSNNNIIHFKSELNTILRRYKRNCYHIRRLLQETDRSYEEINEKNILSNEKFSEIQPSVLDRQFIERLATQPLAFIICSQTYGGKARFVNEILNEPLLPEPPVIQNTDVVRMIKVKHHLTTGASLNISGSFELIDINGVQRSVTWLSVPPDEIVVKNENEEHFHPSVNGPDDQIETPLLEIRKPIDMLGKDLQILVSPSNQNLHIKQIYRQMTEDVMPLFIYIIDQDKLLDNDFEELKLFRTIAKDEPILFIRMANTDTSNDALDTAKESSEVHIFRQLCELGFVSILPSDSSDQISDSNPSLFQSDIIDSGLSNYSLFLNYISKHVDRLTIRAVRAIQQSQELCLDIFNDTAFEMARDILVTPKRLNYAREKEKELYESLINLTNAKQSEIQRIIVDAMKENEEALAAKACSLEMPNVELTDEMTVKTARDLRRCTSTIQEFVLQQLNKLIGEKLSSSISILNQDYVGTLTRCLAHLEGNNDDDEMNSLASKALQDILQSAYKVNITIETSSNLFKILIDKIKEIFQTFRWNSCQRIDPNFKHSVALNILQRLNEAKLAKGVCTQLNDRIRLSHENFESLLKRLEHQHSDRLKSTEDKQQRVRKDCTPTIARLLLESTSLKDLISYGLPKAGREIGRGQYGVVYECDSWANTRSCVIKSVIPPDERHWNDLALEFHYLRRIPEHPRVVKLVGSVMDYTIRDYTPVLLVMERLARDLHAALKHKLEFDRRIRIALDVVEGLRYLHGLGLVHRDIKLKNVLLDTDNRARLTDLGFCKPEVMMSGSLVGTPIHMAPELFSSKYDHTVDVYAFGILFWYICSNGVKLPMNFEMCSTKDVLWSKVRQGLRPERLDMFTDECWDIMKKCWDPQPSERPYLGEVQGRLEQIFSRVHINV